MRSVKEIQEWLETHAIFGYELSLIQDYLKNRGFRFNITTFKFSPISETPNYELFKEWFSEEPILIPEEVRIVKNTKTETRGLIFNTNQVLSFNTKHFKYEVDAEVSDVYIPLKGCLIETDFNKIKNGQIIFHGDIINQQHLKSEECYGIKINHNTIVYSSYFEDRHASGIKVIQINETSPVFLFVSNE